ncbi:MAG: alanyl-tRNA synthetase [Blastocatellia bacterium]|jgi:alanyl-tRNA synthetase|nr:alanyl-tRNA synthetase [Blastocatellia bacterium]
MPPTERLYYDDSHLIDFDAQVVNVESTTDGRLAVTLDRTAFYPTGGGQPNDTGTLASARVVDCIEGEGASVQHVIEGTAPSAGETVHGSIDWKRRLDHLQQHSGQHILSQAFVSLFGAETRGFRMLDQVCEIDVALDQPTDEKIQQAVDLANQIVWEDRVVTIRHVTPEEAATLPLRKEPAVAGELRLIEIAGFDLTPCGGTHAQRTGEVGVLAVRSWERAKGLTRIEFVAGGRALADYRRANDTARRTAALFSAGRDDGSALAERMLEDNKELHRRIRALEEIAARVEAEELLRDAGIDSRLGNIEVSGYTVREGSISGPRIVAQSFDNRDADALKRLALALVAHPQTIALLGSRDKETARLVFARSPDAPGDMNGLMRKACEMIEGRGGGKADLAQGGGKNVEKLNEAIELAASTLS